MKPLICLLACCFSFITIFAQTSTPVAFYPFNGNAQDAIGTNHGTVNGATLTSDRNGNVNSAYSFDGIDDYIQFPTSGYTGIQSYTVQFWIRSNAANVATHIWESTNLSAPSLEGSATTGYNFYVGNSSPISTGPLNTGEWYLITCVYDKPNNTQTLYVNTTLKGTNTINVNDVIGSQLYFMNRPGYYPRNVNGVLDEVKIYSSPLTASQILDEYTSSNSNNQTELTLPVSVLSGGTQGTCSNTNTNNMNGGNATGVGCGGGGAGFWGGHGGNGLLGGGGGGAAGLNTANRVGGQGGHGAIALALANSNGTILSNKLLISGSSFTIPSGVTQAKVFVIGAGGGGGGATANDGSAGGGGGAGGVAYKKYTVASGDIMTYTIGVGGAGGIDVNDGSAGTNTTATINGVTITGNGGNGGLFNNNLDALGGSFSGGDGGTTGGNGKGTVGDTGGGAGGAIGGGYNSSVTCGGGVGGSSQDIDILFGILNNSINNIDKLPTLIAHYPFNGNAGDSSGNNLHGTIIGSVPNVADRNGNPNSAVSFDGNIANRIEVDDNILLHTPSITISAWVKLNSLGSIKTFVDKPMGSSYADSWHFGTENGNFSSWYFNDPNPGPYSQVVSPAGTGLWYFVVNTFDNNTKQHKLYVDGLLKASNTYNNSIGYDASKMYIGAAIEYGGLAYPMDGSLDDIKIYSGALSAFQIQNEYSANVAANKPGSGNGVQLDGSDDYVQLPAVLNGATQFTIDFWIKTYENRSNGTYWLKPTILGNANPGMPDGDFGITTNNGQIGVWHGFCCGDQNLQTSKAINDNQWHHVAAVNNGSNLVLYVDGILLSGSIPTGGGAIQNAARPWRIGLNNSCCGASAHQGIVDEFKFWNVALTESQIRDRMCRKIESTDALYSNLVAYYNFDESSGSTALDNTTNNNHASMFNGASRVTSGAPIGNTSAHNYASAAASINIANPLRGDDITVTLTSGAADGVHVYNVHEAPNTRSGIEGLENNDGYFGAFVVGGTSPTFNTVYNYDGIPNINDENALSLFSRNDNSTTIWTGELATNNATANTLTKNAISASQKEFIVGANDPGNISANQSSCIAITPNPLTGTAAFNGASGVTYQWQDSILGGTWQNISGATNASPLVLPFMSSPKYVRRLASSGSLTLYSNVVFLDIRGAIEPSVLPSNQWNLYAYDGASVDSIGVSYKGSYSRNTLGINTIADYTSNGLPHSASGYEGCNLTAPGNVYSLYAKRKGFPAGSYALNIPQHDDIVKIYQDGVLILTAPCCNNIGSQFYTLGTLDANSVLECRVTNNGGGPGHIVADIFLQNLNGGTIGSNQGNCAAFTPSLINNLHQAYGGSSKTISYQWQGSSDNSTFNDIPGENNLSYQPGLITTDTYFRRKATNANNEVAFSNVVMMDINGPLFYADVDGDGFGDPNNFIQACAAPPGYLSNNSDCNDNDTIEKPGRVWYIDADNDGYKRNDITLTQCNRPINGKTSFELVSNEQDCNDTNHHIHPGAQYLTYSGANNFSASFCYPHLGDAFTNFRYEVMYYNIYNELPPLGAPRLAIDVLQDFLVGPLDKIIAMQEDDLNDLTTSDGKKYIATVNGLPPNYPIQSIVSPNITFCGFNPPEQNTPQVVTFPNLSILAKDITFNNYNPDVSTSIIVTAVVKNPSSHDVSNIPVRLINQFDTTIQYAVQTIPFIAKNNTASVQWIITTPAISALCPMKVVVDYGNTLSETNENDNTAIRAFVNGSGSVSGGIAVTSSVSPKTITILNPNIANTAYLVGNASYTGLAASLNNIPVPGAEVLITIDETGLNYYGFTEADGSFSIPFTVPTGAGTYHISGTVYNYTWAGYMNADSNAFHVVEGQLNDDVELIPSLSIQSPLNPIVGFGIQAKYKSANAGGLAVTGPHKNKLTITGPSGFLFEDSTIVSSLGGNSNANEVSIQTPVLTVPGIYLITLSIDADNEVVEANENNNTTTMVVTVQNEFVDIIATSISTNPGSIICSNQLTVKAIITNSGSIATPSSQSAMMNLKLGATVVGSQSFTIPILQANEGVSISKTFTIPYNPNTFTIEIITDVNHQIIEENETNNVDVSTVTLDTCKSDLMLADFCGNIAIEALNNDYTGPVTLKTVIKNSGQAAVNQPVTIRFTFDNNTFFDYVYAASIAPEQIVPVTLPIAALPIGASKMKVEIDPLNTINETNNSNNVSDEKNMGWDFTPVMDGCILPMTSYMHYTNGLMHFFASIKSNNLFARDSVKVNFKISGPGINGLQDMGTSTIYNVQPTCFCPVVASIPNIFLITQPGTYQVHITADANGAIPESNEVNNEVVIAISTQDLPDMKMQTSFINPSSLNPVAGQSITTQVTYENIGISNVSDQMKLKLFIDNVAIDSVTNATGLPINGSTTYTFNTPWSSTQPGVHLIKATIDADNTISEYNENNNTAVRAIIVGDAANMYFDSLASLNLYPQLGDSAIIYTDIGNNGTLGCTSLLTYYFLNDFNDTLLIRNVNVSVAPNGHQIITFKWKVIDEKTVVVAKLTNSTVQEFDYSDNTATFAYGQMKLITESVPACNAGNLGSITAHVLGGSPPFTYSWSNTNTGASMIGGPGNYSVTVFDQSGQQIQGNDSIPVCIGGLLYVKCMLQGFYAGGGTMYPVLTQSGLISPLTYTDSVTIELHANTSGYALTATVTGILHSNGSITCHIPISAIGTQQFIVVKHRNHIETWSASPVIISNGLLYDFAASASQAYGENQLELEANTFGIYSGDVNQDMVIDAFDYLMIEPDIIDGNSGYLITDLNGDGVVDAFDYLVIENNVTKGIGAATP